MTTSPHSHSVEVWRFRVNCWLHSGTRIEVSVCHSQWPLSKLSAVSASTTGLKSLAHWGWAVRSWQVTRKLMTSLRFRTPTSSWQHPCVLLYIQTVQGWCRCRLSVAFRYVCIFLGKVGQHDKKMERPLSAATSQALSYWWGDCVCQLFCSQANVLMLKNVIICQDDVQSC